MTVLDVEFGVKSRSNRTFMELKFRVASSKNDPYPSSNRTFMELKFHVSKSV